MLRISSHVTQYLFFNQYIAQATDFPISANQYYILKLLSIGGPYNLSFIAQTLEISNAAAGKNIDKLVQFKLVKRRFRRADRRVANLSITEAGREIVDNYEQVRVSNQSELLKNYSDSEKEQFIDYIRRFITHTLGEQGNTDLICLQCNETCDEDCVIRECKGQCSFHLLSKSDE